jgi:hypothetical protein
LVNSWHCFLNKTKLKCPQGGFNFPGEIKNTFCFAVFRISLELKSHHLIMGRGISPFPRNKKNDQRIIYIKIVVKIKRFFIKYLLDIGYYSDFN